MERQSSHKQLISWLNSELRPNVYGVATLKQSITEGRRGSMHRIMGDEDRYAAAYRRCLCNLSMALYGRSNWRRHKKLLPNMATLEGNGLGRRGDIRQRSVSLAFAKAVQSDGKRVRFHLNMNFHRPEWIEFEPFKALFLECWHQNPWAMQDVYLEERTGESLAYSLKEGPETLLVDSLSF